MPKISIILPTYNVEKYIARALDSCINQTLKDIEIIVVDDKGQDKSIEIAKEYGSRDNRIKIIDNVVNQGTFKSRNTGILASAGEYIMFLDPDDFLEIDACRIVAENFNNFDLLIFDAMVIRDNISRPMRMLKNNILNLQDYKKDFNAFGWELWNKAYKREIVLQVLKNNDDLKHEGIGNDALLHYLIVLKMKNNICIIDKILYHYNVHLESNTNTKNIKSIERNLRAYDNILNILDENNDHNSMFYQKYKCYILMNKYDYIMKINKLKRYKNIKYLMQFIRLKILRKMLKYKINYCKGSA